MSEKSQTAFKCRHSDQIRTSQSFAPDKSILVDDVRYVVWYASFYQSVVDLQIKYNVMTSIYDC